MIERAGNAAPAGSDSGADLFGVPGGAAPAGVAQPAVLPRASVVIAAYQRAGGVRSLLGMLARQTVPPGDFEVIVVDDGSAVPLTLDDVQTPYPLTVIRQANAGPAAARDTGVRAARGSVLIIVDDDMQIGDAFIEGHLAVHPAESRRAALGPINPDPNVDNLPLFEQWNAERLLRVTRSAAGGARVSGNSLWTGNVSLRRADYFAVGGFDRGLRVSEDLELGLRLEQSGVDIVFAPAAPAVHRSDHPNATWLRRASMCGRADKVVARKHPNAVQADPWRYYFVLPRIVRPMLDLVIAIPAAGEPVAGGLARLGQLALRLGLRSAALRMAAVAYAVEYFRGIRLEEGTRGACRRSLRNFLARAATLAVLPAGVPRRRAHWARMRADLASDHATRAAREAKYGYAGTHGMRPLSAAVHKIGVQMMNAIRLMIFFRDARYPLLARITSRLIRHLYSSDVHWDAQWGPGTMLVHGFGLAISHAARIGPDCVVFQNVCLGMGIDAQTRATGAPTLGRDVHVGPGATLLGPIVIGEGTKIMAGAVVMTSVPASSLVETPAPSVRPRAASGALADDSGAV